MATWLTRSSRRGRGRPSCRSRWPRAGPATTPATPTACRSAPITTLTSEPSPEASEGPSDEATDEHEGHDDGHGHEVEATKPKPLRQGEKRMTLSMPAAYTPSAPNGTGTDDYRCFLLDPHLAKDAFLTGTFVQPGNAEVVHHVILFAVPPDMVADAEAMDAGVDGRGLDLLRRLAGCATTTASTARRGWARGRRAARSR